MVTPASLFDSHLLVDKYLAVFAPSHGARVYAIVFLILNLVILAGAWHLRTKMA